MFEVYWTDWEGRDEDPAEVFNTYEEAEAFGESMVEDSYYEPASRYIIHDVEKDLWY